MLGQVRICFEGMHHLSESYLKGKNAKWLERVYKNISMSTLLKNGVLQMSQDTERLQYLNML